ncbi:MAG: tRNA 4-thiouridine(8) synthase ThiI [Spirochaetaceae bacterium]|nr:tRNA 4-thiouridine(8) synthase ThiI [Spirochaetaceae bacterium]
MTVTYLGKVGELTLKGSNLKEFEKKLGANLKIALGAVPNIKIRVASGRLYVDAEEQYAEAVEYALKHLLGITGWAKTQAVEKNMDAIKAAVVAEAQRAKERGCSSFKIESRRSDKNFALNSYQINCEAASPIFDGGLLAVDVHKPDVMINVEVREKCAYVYSDAEKGRRGLPVGVSGKGLLLLSGGIDSPVAGYRMMRRGMRVECVYFHSYPYTSAEAQQKVETLAKTLGDFGVDTHLNVIPFTDVQMRIKQKSPVAWTTLMLRVCMMKAANLLAARIGAQCIITGESLGQVASQTIENMSVTEHFASLPLLRPLVGMDKEEIVATAEEIGTFETSILPYEDCCVLFSPKHPILRGTIEEAEKIYQELEIDDLIREAYEKRQIIWYSAHNNIAKTFVGENAPLLESY